MPFIGQISRVSSEPSGGTVVEWKIPNFFSYAKENSHYDSYDFHAFDSIWHLSINPNGHTSRSTGFISFYLGRRDLGSPKNINFALGMKTANNMIENNHTANFTFTKESTSPVGFHEFLERSELQRRRSELAPTGTLNLTCTMKVKDDASETFSGLDRLSADLKDMFISNRNSDATVKVKDKVFSVHKTVLAARSPVFAAMFENELSEKNTGVVNIADCEVEAFYDFLLYLYSGKIQNCQKPNPFHLYKIADKYDVQDLKSSCVSFIMRNLSVENILHAVALGYQFSEIELTAKAQDFFNENFSKIVSTANWETLLEQDCHLANQLLKGMAPKIKMEK